MLVIGLDFIDQFLFLQFIKIVLVVIYDLIFAKLN